MQARQRAGRAASHRGLPAEAPALRLQPLRPTMTAIGAPPPACVQEFMEAVEAGDIPQQCSACGGLHFMRRTERPVAAARTCDECGTRHAVRENEVWFESESAGARGRGPSSGSVRCWLCCGTCRGGGDSQPVRASVRARCQGAAAAGKHASCGTCWPLGAGFMRRTIRMYACYKGAVYDMRWAAGLAVRGQQAVRGQPRPLPGGAHTTTAPSGFLQLRSPAGQL